MRTLTGILIICGAAVFCSLSSVAEEGSGGGGEEETLLGYVLEACEEDLGEYCDRVTPGNGRIAMCLAAYEDQITTECTMALYDAAAIMEAIVDEIVYLAESCATDIDELCAGTVMGEGRILMCLNEQRAEVSESCEAALSELDE